MGKPQKQVIFTSCGGLRVLAAQELLACALFLGCTVLVGTAVVAELALCLTIFIHRHNASAQLYTQLKEARKGT